MVGGEGESDVLGGREEDGGRMEERSKRGKINQSATEGTTPIHPPPPYLPEPVKIICQSATTRPN